MGRVLLEFAKGHGRVNQQGSCCYKITSVTAIFASPFSLYVQRLWYYSHTHSSVVRTRSVLLALK